MESNRIDDVRVPSGYEVESASLHLPAPAGEAPHAHARTWKEKLVAMPREQFARVAPKINSVKSNVSRQMHEKPALYAGIAAGAAFFLGMAGRIARKRIARRSMPSFVIVEGNC